MGVFMSYEKEDTIQQELEEFLKNKHIYTDALLTRNYYEDDDEYALALEHSLDKADAVVVRIDKTTRCSRCVKQHLEAAHKKGKPLIAYYIENVKLSNRMKQLLSAADSIYEYEYADKQSARDELFERIRVRLNLQYEKNYIRSGTTYVKYIGKGRVVTVPEGITALGTHAFAKNNRIQRVILPQSLKVIGSYAFHECKNLKTVDIQQGVTRIGIGAFSGCNVLKSVVIPLGVTAIRMGAFAFCFALESVTLHDGITSIEDSAFYCCNNITTLNMPQSLEKIGNRAFAVCSSLEGITLPPSLKTIDRKAFSGCDSITEVFLPPSVESIGAFAFESCNSLKRVTFLCTKANLSNGVFNFSTEVEEVVLPRGASVKDLIKTNSFPCVKLLLNGGFKGCTATSLQRLAFALIENVVSMCGFEDSKRLLEVMASLRRNKTAPLPFVRSMLDEAMDCAQTELVAYLMNYKRTHYPNERGDLSL